MHWSLKEVDRLSWHFFDGGEWPAAGEHLWSLESLSFCDSVGAVYCSLVWDGQPCRRIPLCVMVRHLCFSGWVNCLATDEMHIMLLLVEGICYAVVADDTGQSWMSHILRPGESGTYSGRHALKCC